MILSVAYNVQILWKYIYKFSFLFCFFFAQKRRNNFFFQKKPEKITMYSVMLQLR